MTREDQVNGLENVHIPTELSASLDRFFSDLKLRVLQRAAHRAMARQQKSAVCVLEKDDLVSTALIALAEAKSELDKALLPSEPQHVRRAS